MCRGGPPERHGAEHGGRGVSEDERTDLPQPGLDDEEDPSDDAAPGHRTEGQGNVSVDEPTETSLDPESEHEGWP